VLQALVGNGGRLIDTASSYGDAESVLGGVIATAGLREKVFIATKLEVPDAVELERSLSRLKTEKLDLLQLHNVRDRNNPLLRSRHMPIYRRDADFTHWGVRPRPFRRRTRLSRG